jgi:hypothetical protein
MLQLFNSNLVWAAINGLGVGSRKSAKLLDEIVMMEPIA